MIAVVVQFTEMVVRKTSPLLHRVLGVFLPLITTNCAVLGVALLNINQAHNFIESLFYGLGAALGFSLVLVLFAAMRERLTVADVPEPFQGAAIGMITAGLASLRLYGLCGVDLMLALLSDQPLSSCTQRTAGTGRDFWRLTGLCRHSVPGRGQPH